MADNLDASKAEWDKCPMCGRRDRVKTCCIGVGQRMPVVMESDTLDKVKAKDDALYEAGCTFKGFAFDHTKQALEAIDQMQWAEAEKRLHRALRNVDAARRAHATIGTIKVTP